MLICIIHLYSDWKYQHICNGCFWASPSQGKVRLEFWDEILHEYLLQVIQVSTQITMRWQIQRSIQMNKVHHHLIETFSIYSLFLLIRLQRLREWHNFKKPTEQMAVRMRQQKIKVKVKFWERESGQMSSQTWTSKSRQRRLRSEWGRWRWPDMDVCSQTFPTCQKYLNLRYLMEEI